MIRKIVTVVAALACAAGLSFVSAGSASASVLPTPGSYNGVDHHRNLVSFSYNGNQISHFKVGHVTIGTAHISNGAWHERCADGYCFKGHWQTQTHVVGFWRHGGSHEWTSFSAYTTAIQPYTGSYSGRDHTGLRIHFTYSHGHLRGFTWDHNLIGDAAVDHAGYFNVCHRSLCFKGHWQSDYYVVGEWRHVHDHTWRPWDANAYSA
jgi:hypothetical protein